MRLFIGECFVVATCKAHGQVQCILYVFMLPLNKQGVQENVYAGYPASSKEIRDITTTLSQCNSHEICHPGLDVRGLVSWGEGWSVGRSGSGMCSCILH